MKNKNRTVHRIISSALFLVMFLASYTIYAQDDIGGGGGAGNIHVGLKAGATSNIWGNDYGACREQKYGAMFGVVAGYDINSNIEVGLELNYAIIGASGNLNKYLYLKPVSGNTTDFFYSVQYSKVNLHYIQIPVIATYKVDNLRLFGGLGYGALLQGVANNTINLTPSSPVDAFIQGSDNVSNVFQKSDVFGILGAGYTFDKFFVEARYQFGLRNINVINSGYGYYNIYNNTIAISFGYKFM